MIFIKAGEHVSEMMAVARVENHDFYLKKKIIFLFKLDLFDLKK